MTLQEMSKKSAKLRRMRGRARRSAQALCRLRRQLAVMAREYDASHDAVTAFFKAHYREGLQ